MGRNPYQVGLLVVGGLCLMLAFMLYVVSSELTDYTTYNVAEVVTVVTWGYLLVAIAAMTFVGAAVLSGVGWAMRRANEGVRSDEVAPLASAEETPF